MEGEIVKFAMDQGQGLFAVLFVALLFYVLKHNEKREERLMQCLEKLSPDVEWIKEDVKEIKGDLAELKEKVG